jgi:triosephosphate isomerase
MRNKIIAGNWKMHMDHIEGATLAAGIAEGLRGRKTAREIILIPPFTTIPSVVPVVDGTSISIGAQDLWFEEKGAFTGEISGLMLTGLGCKYVLVGHSERRHVIGERHDLLSLKLRAALDVGLTPIYCVGEDLDQRERGKAPEVVSDQIEQVLKGLSGDGIARTMLAYEPVWAIGTGKTATPEDAESMHHVIRELISRMFGGDIADRMLILYGGSVKPENAARLLSCNNIDGALVGGASLDAQSFLGIVFS